MRAIIALAVLVGCAETDTTAEVETTEETETTETTETTAAEAFEDVADRVEENFESSTPASENITPTPPASATTPSGQSAVSSD